MNRKLVAAYACRVQGTRLYGKPLQNLDIKNGISIINHIIDLTKTILSIDEIVLGVSEGMENDAFYNVAKNNKILAIEGSQSDVLKRLIDSCRKANGTDVFRITTESPFFYYEYVDQAWHRHVQNNNDVTVIDGLPEGASFEIYSLNALERSHRDGEDRHRSEFCSLYVRENRDKFKIDIIEEPIELARMDIRLTVDYPEDLILCRKIYEELYQFAPRIPLIKIINFLDKNPSILNLTKPFVVPERLW